LSTQRAVRQSHASSTCSRGSAPVAEATGSASKAATSPLSVVAIATPDGETASPQIGSESLEALSVEAAEAIDRDTDEDAEMAGAEALAESMPLTLPPGPDGSQSNADSADADLDSDFADSDEGASLPLPAPVGPRLVEPVKPSGSCFEPDLDDDDDDDLDSDAEAEAAADESTTRAFREDPSLDRRIIEGMLDDREIFLAAMAKEGFTSNAVLRRAAELGLSEALVRQVKGVAADLAGERPGRRAAPSALGARTCLSCDRVFLSSGPGNRLCMRCRGGDAGLAQL
jgi:hypothetical protein